LTSFQEVVSYYFANIHDAKFRGNRSLALLQIAEKLSEAVFEY